MRKKYDIYARVYDKKGRLLSSAQNNYKKSHPLMLYFAKKLGMEEKIYLHAEVLALIRAGEGNGHKIVVERYHQDGTPALAKPCPICAEAIKAFGIKEIQYTQDMMEEFCE